MTHRVPLSAVHVRNHRRYPCSGCFMCAGCVYVCTARVHGMYSNLSIAIRVRMNCLFTVHMHSERGPERASKRAREREKERKSEDRRERKREERRERKSKKLCEERESDFCRVQKEPFVGYHARSVLELFLSCARIHTYTLSERVLLDEHRHIYTAHTAPTSDTLTCMHNAEQCRAQATVYAHTHAYMQSREWAGRDRTE